MVAGLQGRPHMQRELAQGLELGDRLVGRALGSLSSGLGRSLAVSLLPGPQSWPFPQVQQ